MDVCKMVRKKWANEVEEEISMLLIIMQTLHQFYNNYVNQIKYSFEKNKKNLDITKRTILNFDYHIFLCRF